MPYFSVIIPTYNRLSLLKEALESVWRQTFTAYEVIVVDDGSTDGTGDFARSLTGRLKLFQQANGGPGAARNLGIANAQGEYIAFLDSDDLWFPWTLETYYQATCNASKPAFICGREVKIKDGQDVVAPVPEAANFTNYPDYLNSSHESIWIGTCSAAIKASIFKEVGGFSDARMNAEDSDLWLRLGTAQGFVRIESPPVFGHRNSPESAVANKEHAFRGLLALLDGEKHGRYPGGQLRRMDRWRILARHVRPGSINLLREGCCSYAFALYRRSFVIQVALRRFRYLVGFWLVLLSRMTTRHRK